jgi:hypothetical protein
MSGHRQSASFMCHPGNQQVLTENGGSESSRVAADWPVLLIAEDITERKVLEFILETEVWCWCVRTPRCGSDGNWANHEDGRALPHCCRVLR